MTLQNNFLNLVFAMLLSVWWSTAALAVELNIAGMGTATIGDASPVRGRPETQLVTPLSKDIYDDAENRCRIIKTMKPGEYDMLGTKENTAFLLSRYSTELYLQAAKSLFEFDKEKPASSKARSSEKAILDKDILQRKAYIADRLNIVLSLEARTLHWIVFLS